MVKISKTSYYDGLARRRRTLPQRRAEAGSSTRSRRELRVVIPRVGAVETLARRAAAAAAGAEDIVSEAPKELRVVLSRMRDDARPELSSSSSLPRKELRIILSRVARSEGTRRASDSSSEEISATPTSTLTPSRTHKRRKVLFDSDYLRAQSTPRRRARPPLPGNREADAGRSHVGAAEGATPRLIIPLERFDVEGYLQRRRRWQRIVAATASSSEETTDDGEPEEEEPRNVVAGTVAVRSPSPPAEPALDDGNRVVDRVRSPSPPATPPASPPVHENPPRRRGVVVPHRVTWRLARCPTAETLNNLLETPHSSGAFNEVCRYCGARYFVAEPKNRQGVRLSCCKQGDVHLPALRIPTFFRQLYTAEGRRTTEFLTNIRAINSLFAMASFKTSTLARRVEGRGHWSFSICGQIYHYTVGVPSTQELRNPRLSHYYFLDVDEVMDRRCAMLEDRAAPELVRAIDVALRHSHRYVGAFRTMGEVLEEEKRRRGGVRPVRDVVIGFSRAGDMKRLTRQHNLPESRHEIAAVFYGTEPPFAVDLKLYPREARRQEGAGEEEEEEAAIVHHELKNMHPMADPLVYPLLFPCGEDGWSAGLRHNDRHRITMREFYRYRLQTRDAFSLLHNGGKLFQQYVVDAWVRVEADVLFWYKQNQDKFRFAQKNVLTRIMAGGLQDDRSRIGRAVVLPSGFIGGPRFMQRQYLDAMAVVARHGKPDLFVTFTCNPAWPEISENLRYRQRPEHRPDLTCRVFRTKLLEFMDDVVHKQIYGVVQNYHYVIEFQKRGLPHAHIVVTFVGEDKIVTADQVDALISARLPDVAAQPQLHALVAKHQIHRPCGVQNPNAPCMVDGRCGKYFPKEYAEATVLGAGGDRRPIYKRPDDGRVAITTGNRVVNNTRVVPYNSYALCKFRTHINFEVVGSLATMKYLYKYVTKGVDCATIVEEGGEAPVAAVVGERGPRGAEGDGTRDREEFVVDEISNYLDCRYVSAMEAAWRIFEFKTHDRSHAVMVVPVHLEGEGHVTYDPNEEAAVTEGRLQKATKLEAWFALNAEDAEARRYRYVEIPEHYVWNGVEGSWHRRRQTAKMIGCLAEVTPREGNLELFYLRQLLRYVPGATSYAALRTFRGIRHESFQEACRARNLLLDAEEFDRCLAEAATFQLPGRMRRLFGLIVCALEPERLADVSVLWERYADRLTEDYARRGLRRREASQRFVTFLDNFLRRNKPQLTCAGLGIAVRRAAGDDDGDDDGADDDGADDDDDEVGSVARRTAMYDPATLNFHQKIIFLRVVRAVASRCGGGGGGSRPLPLELYEAMGRNVINAVIDTEKRGEHLFYVDGPGGTGKTFLYNCLINYVRNVLGSTVRAVAWTGIAANLLIGGTTAHRCFKFPITLNAESVVGWSTQSAESEALRNVGLIVWDEAPMTHRFAVEALDRYLRDVTGLRGVSMGGRCVVFGGDFRQVLPVIPHGHRASIIGASLKCSELWRELRRHRLTVNMRTAGGRPAEEQDDGEEEGDGSGRRRRPRPRSEPERFVELGNRSFADWLLALGEGRLENLRFQRDDEDDITTLKDLIEIPPMFVCQSVRDLLDFVYGGDYVGEGIGDKAVLCPTNAMVNDVNDSILRQLGGDAVTYVSLDECKKDEADRFRVSVDLLNSVNVAGLPPHELTLKVGAVVMLLRNLDVDRGECNGTRMRVLRLGEHLIECELLAGERRGQRVWLPRIRMIARDSMLPYEVMRTQYPVRLAYALTINKAQGQTLSKIGIYLKGPCFTHGQLYVAFSRARCPRNVKVVVEDGPFQGQFRGRWGKKFTRNVVFHSILEETANDDDHAELEDPLFEERSQFEGQQPQFVEEQPQQPERQRTPSFSQSECSNVMETDDFDHIAVELDPFVDHHGDDLPLLFAPYRNEEELRRRVSVLDRPGTTGLVLQSTAGGKRPRWTNASSSSSEDD